MPSKKNKANKTHPLVLCMWAEAAKVPVTVSLPFEQLQESMMDNQWELLPESVTVAPAKRKHRRKEVEYGSAEDYLQEPLHPKWRLHKARCDASDLSYPIVVGRYERGGPLQVLDGLHRICKIIEQQIASTGGREGIIIQCKMLSLEAVQRVEANKQRPGFRGAAATVAAAAAIIALANQEEEQQEEEDVQTNAVLPSATSAEANLTSRSTGSTADAATSILPTQTIPLFDDAVPATVSAAANVPKISPPSEDPSPSATLSTVSAPSTTLSIVSAPSRLSRPIGRPRNHDAEGKEMCSQNRCVLYGTNNRKCEKCRGIRPKRVIRVDAPVDLTTIPLLQETVQLQQLQIQELQRQLALAMSELIAARAPAVQSALAAPVAAISLPARLLYTLETATVVSTAVAPSTATIVASTPPAAPSTSATTSPPPPPHPLLVAAAANDQASINKANDSPQETLGLLTTTATTPAIAKSEKRKKASGSESERVLAVLKKQTELASRISKAAAKNGWSAQQLHRVLETNYTMFRRWMGIDGPSFICHLSLHRTEHMNAQAEDVIGIIEAGPPLSSSFSSTTAAKKTLKPKSKPKPRKRKVRVVSDDSDETESGSDVEILSAKKKSKRVVVPEDENSEDSETEWYGSDGDLDLPRRMKNKRTKKRRITESPSEGEEEHKHNVAEKNEILLTPLSLDELVAGIEAECILKSNSNTTIGQEEEEEKTKTPALLTSYRRIRKLYRSAVQHGWLFEPAIVFTQLENPDCGFASFRKWIQGSNGTKNESGFQKGMGAQRINALNKSVLQLLQSIKQHKDQLRQHPSMVCSID